jgi:putative FmdB family regulatory protein
MPTYTYKCEHHGEFDIEHSITEKLEDCPKCQEEGLTPHKVVRLISGTGGFILQGGGWAREGYS